MKIKAAFFDMDGTLTTVMSPWQFVHETLEIWDNRAEIYWQEWLDGKIAYDKFCQKEIALWNEKNVNLDYINSILDTIPLNKYNKELFALLVSKSIPIIIISAGFRHTAKRIYFQSGKVNFLGFTNHLTDDPDNGAIIPQINVFVDEGHPFGKGSIISKVCKWLNIDEKETIGIGDSIIADKEMFQTCGIDLLVQQEKDILKVIKYCS